MTRTARDGSAFYGIEHDLTALVETHLFVLCPNHSGSTFMKNVLGWSAHTWNLAREGQHIFGFVGPRKRDLGRQLIWAACPDWIESYRDPSHFDWQATRAAWYAQAVARSPCASVMVEKTPPFLLIPELLVAAFERARFVLMVREPYAAYEGIIRRRLPPPPDKPGHDPRVLAARHVVACFEQQRRNRERLAERSVFFTYETLCADPDGCAARIERLVPALDDLDLARRTAVKGLYDEPLRNMNAQQLARLAPEDRRVAREVFVRSAELFEHFGYEVD